MKPDQIIFIAMCALVVTILIVTILIRKRKAHKKDCITSYDEVRENAVESQQEKTVISANGDDEPSEKTAPAVVCNENPINRNQYREPISVKIIISFIAVVLAYVAVIMFGVSFAIFPNMENPTLPIVMAILFVILGSVGFFLAVGHTHILALVANIASRPSVAIVYLLISTVIFVINAIRDSNIKMPSFSLNRNLSLTVNDGGYTRYLEFKDYRQDYDGYGTNPYYGKSYQLYIDDIGVCWRSYDGGNTFIKTGYSDDL